jgi:hypothetical protein
MPTPRIAATALLTASILTACAGGDVPTAPIASGLAVEDAGHNAAEHHTTVGSVEFTIDNPCDPTLRIEFVGQEEAQETVVDTREHLDQGFSVHREFQVYTEADGVDQEGNTYTIQDRYRENFESPSPPAPQFTFFAHANTRVTSDTPGLSFVVRFGFHFVGLPTGDFLVTRDIESAVCGN